MVRAFLFLFCTMLTGVSLAAEQPPQALQIFSRERPALLSFTLDDSQWRWLGLKRELKVATWAPNNPPFDIVPDTGIYEGIYADYIKLVASNLGLSVQVLRYASRADALHALMRKEVDVVMDDGGGQQIQSAPLTETRSLMANRSALVTRESSASHAVTPGMAMKLAVTEGYLTDAEITGRFSGAEIVRFSSSQDALSCVLHARCDYFLGNLTTASFLIERNYSNELTITDVYPEASPGSRFLLRDDAAELKQAIDTVLIAIPDAQKRVISRQWVQRQDIWRFEQPLDLTEREKRWIANNPTVKVLVNPFFTPFTMLDEQGEFHGISADLLRLIHLRTGLRFEPVKVNSATELFDALGAKRGDLVGAAIFSPLRENVATFSRPWLYTPGVLVVRNAPEAPSALNNNLTLAVVKDNALAAQLAKTWPGIHWIYTDNAGEALELVNAGKVDGALNNQMGAGFMIERYFRDKLKIVTRLGDTPTQLGFAVRRDEPELLGIMNKALADMLPQEISLIVHKWQSAPDIKVDTWQLYDKQFYWVLAGAGSIILLVLFWVYTRNKEIRRRQLAQEALQAQLTFRDTLLNGSPSPIYVLNRQFVVTTHNEAFQAYFSQHGDDYLHYSLFDLRHPLASLREDLTQILLHHEDATPHGQTREFVVNNGSEERIIAHWATPYDDSRGKTAGLICGWQDITEHKHLLHQLSVEKEHAEQANQAKSTFLATMSHEIRTPIGAIIGLLELEVARQPDNDAVLVAFTSAQTLMGLIGDVLDMAKIESGQLELAPEWLPLDSLLPPVIRVFEEMARQKQLSLYFQSDIEPDAEILVDAGRLRQVIANYLSNAVKFTVAGQIDVRINSQRSTTDFLLLHIAVGDSGPGISQADREKLFKPFIQLEAGRRQTGTGLGLVIGSQLLEKMEGTMKMHSIPGRGTQILIELSVPLRQARLPAIPNDLMKTGRSPKLSILIVDDHPVNRMVLQRQLARLGHQVTEADSGQQALARWRKAHFDLLITDCTMPEMDGFTLTQKIRQAGGTLTIFGLTANAQSEIRAQALAAGMNECLFKPLHLSQLEAALLKVQKTEPFPALHEQIRLDELAELLHHDDQMLRQLLSRICEENDSDLKEARRLFATGDFSALASCLHRLGGAAQVIYAAEIDALCAKTEALCLQQENTPQINERLLELENKLSQLTLAIKSYLMG